jgi:hypothetical protein
MVRSFLALRAVTLGFTHPEQIQTVRIFDFGGADTRAGASSPNAG